MADAHTSRFVRPRSLTGPMIAMIAANLVPFVGLIAFDWDPWSVVAGYWAESAVVGVWYIVRIATCRQAQLSALFVVPFFTFHFGVFMFVHGTFLGVFRQLSGAGGTLAAPTQDDGGFSWGPLTLIAEGHTTATLAWMLVPLAVSHGIATLRDHFLNGRFRTISPPDAMAEPYSRIFVMHIAIIVGMFIGMLLGGFTTALMATFIVVKIVADAKSLATLERRHDAARPTPSAA